MKIAILSFYSGLRDRGVENYVKNLALRLVKKHQILVFQSGKSLTSRNYRIIIIPVKFSFENQKNNFLKKFYLDYSSLKILIFTLKVLRYLVKEKPDILIPTNNGWQSLLLKLYSLIFKVPLVLAGHSGFGQDDILNLKLHPSVFICFSQTQAKWAKKINPQAKIKVIPHAVDLNFFKPGLKPTNIDLPKPIIICVSALEKYKRVDLLIKAVSLLKKGSLLVVTLAEQKEKELIQKLGHQKLKERFKLMEASFSQMPSLYNTAQLFSLVSSSQEAFGLVYLEAMACGLPVVAPDDSLRREIIGQAGLFVKNPQDSLELASKIEEALKIDWKNKPRQQAEKFNWEKIIQQYEELFKELKL